MKKYILTYPLITAFLMLVGSAVHAQQIAEFSLIRENAVALNPAMTGVQGYMSGLATFRKEFTQISGSPYTAFVMMEGQVADKNIGIGGAVIADQTGPTGRIGGTISASYQLKIGRAYDYVNAERGHYNTATDHMITFGLSLSFMQFRVNGSELNPLQTGDPQLFSNNVYKFAPDAAFGIYYQWMQHLYLGVSVPQILGLNESFTGHNGVANIQTVRHFNMLAGGKIDVVKGKFSIDPVGAFRWVKNAPPQGDIGTRFTFLNSIWVGGTYRSLNTFVLDAGIEIKTMIRICYAYDYHFASYTSDIGPTHELTVAFRYNHIPLRQMKMIGGEYR